MAKVVVELVGSVGVPPKPCQLGERDDAGCPDKVVAHGRSLQALGRPALASLLGDEGWRQLHDQVDVSFVVGGGTRRRARHCVLGVEVWLPELLQHVIEISRPFESGPACDTKKQGQTTCP